MLVYGIVLLLFLRFLSQGVLGTVDRLRNRRRSESEDGVAFAAAEKRK
jgi:hypothetical protein